MLFLTKSKVCVAVRDLRHTIDTCRSSNVTGNKVLDPWNILFKPLPPPQQSGQRPSPMPMFPVQRVQATVITKKEIDKDYVKDDDKRKQSHLIKFLPYH